MSKKELGKEKNKKNNNSNKLKKYIFLLILIISILGIIVPYAAEFILPFFVLDKQIEGIRVWNQYVSLILGMIATIMSVVSLILCFRSEEKNNALLSKINKGLQSLDFNVKEIRKKQDADTNKTASTIDITSGDARVCESDTKDEIKP